MNTLLSLLSAVTLGSSTASAIVPNIKSNTSINLVTKTNISSFRFQNTNIAVNINDEDVRSTVFLNLLSKYQDPEYQAFLTDLYMDFTKTKFIISGDNFKVPQKGDFTQYIIRVLASPRNQSYQGFTTIYVTLSLDENKYNISSINSLTNKDEVASYLDLTSDLTYESANAKPKEDEILSMLDTKMLEKGESQWVIDNNLFIEHKNVFSFGINEIVKNNTKLAEKYFKVTLGVSKDDSFFELGSSTTFYVHYEANFLSISRSINKSFYDDWKVNWSSKHEWRDPQNYIYHDAQINLGNYVTDNEVINAGSIEKAFAEKYESITFYVSGGFTSYENVYYSIKSAIFNTTDISGLENGASFTIDCGHYHANGAWGNESQGELSITMKILNHELYYYWLAYSEVYGVGAPWEEASIKANLTSIGIR